MPAQALTNVGLNFGWSIGEDGWKAGMDNNLVLLDLLVQPNVFDRNLTAPPGAPAIGDRYLIPPTGATGDWATHGNKFTIWSGAAWLKLAPLPGWRVWIADEGLWLQWSGSVWVARDNAIEIQVAASDMTTVITAGGFKAYVRAPVAFTLLAVRAALGNASSSGAVELDILNNGASILSTALTIDVAEKSSLTAATPAVIATPGVSNDDELSIDVTAPGSGATGLIVTLIGARA